MTMTAVEVFVDPSCPWAWVTSRWLKEVAPRRDFWVTWRSYCLEIRDDFGVAPTVPEGLRGRVIAAHALSHRMLRVMEAARTEGSEEAVDRLFTAWGRLYFGEHLIGDDLLSSCLSSAGLRAELIAVSDEGAWDRPIIESMEVAYAFGGPKTQTPTVVVRDEPAHGFKGPVMAPAPTGDAADRLWDALVVLSKEPGFFEFTRPRVNRPH